MTILKFKNIKTILTTILTIAILFSLNTAVFAAGNINDNTTNQKQAKEDVTITKNNDGVSSKQQTNIMPQGTGIPTQVWNIVDNGRYDFSGVSSGQVLYSNYKFTGKTSYWVCVTNNADTDLIVQAKTALTTYSTQTIPAGFTEYYNIPGMSSSTKFYLRFEGQGGTDMDFSGYIE